VADIGEDSADARPDIFLSEGLGLALAFAQLVVHAPDVVRLLVDQHSAAGVAAWLKERPPLGREVMIHADVSDHIPAFVIVAFQPQPEHGADRRARTVGRQQIESVEIVVSLRR
jgi:hypothetical protein